MFYLISIILIVVIVKNFLYSNQRKRKKQTESIFFNSFNELKKDQIRDADFEEID